MQGVHLLAWGCRATIRITIPLLIVIIALLCDLKAYWAGVKNLNPNILICHARGASVGVGMPSNNKNNHPFVNSDYSIALRSESILGWRKKLKSEYPNLSCKGCICWRGDAEQQ